MISNVGVRLRVRYSKLGKVRFVSDRNGARLWERALRRVDLHVAFTEGFTPRPKLSFGLALPTGAESTAEYIDIDLASGADIDPTATTWSEWSSWLATQLSDALPPGIDVVELAERGADSGSLQEQVTSTTWELTGPEIGPDLLEPATQRLLATDELLVERERKGQRRTARSAATRPSRARRGSERMTRPITRCGGTNTIAPDRMFDVPSGAPGSGTCRSPLRRELLQHEQRSRHGERRRRSRRSVHRRFEEQLG